MRRSFSRTCDVCSRSFFLWGAVSLGLLGAAPALAGDVHISTVTPGASIFLDGAETGLITPSSISEITPGSHTIGVQQGCEQGEIEINIVEGIRNELSIEMTIGSGALTLQPTPAAAVLELGGQRLIGPVGVPISVDCGAHSITASLDGYVSTVLNVNVELGQSVELPIVLQPIGTGSLTVTVSPGNAQLFVDDDPLLNGRRFVDDLISGGHVLRAEADGYEIAEQQFVISNGEHLDLSLALETIPELPPAGSSSSGKKRIGARLSGLSMVVIGTGVSLYSAYEYTVTASNMEEYNTRADQVVDGLVPEDWASDYYTEEVIPHRTRMQVAGGLGGLMLASGVVLVVAF